MMRFFLALLALMLLYADCDSRVLANNVDVVVYGGTSAGVMAAVQTKKMGKSVVLVCPEKHLGGLTSGGLGFTDTGNKAVIGGLAREFYHRIWEKYQDPAAWKWQARESYGNRGQGTPAIDGDLKTQWIFEPHVAEQVFEDLVREFDIPTYRDEWLDRESGVLITQRRIASVRMLSGLEFRADMFIDATYEGDLMAAAGVSYHVGRESTATYGEKWNGIQLGVLHHGHWFKKPVDPYVVPGDPSSGLLPRISGEDPGKKGEGDHRVQAYCFRMCLTDDPRNRRPFPKPEGYDAFQYELLLRVFETGWREGFEKFDAIPNRKTDTNNHGPFSTDNIGFNYDYPEASYQRRQEIIEEHAQYQQGLMYFVANDPRVPEDVRQRMSQWGLARDEFIDNDNWPHQIYVREARRMIGDYVMTEHHCLGTQQTPRPVGMGSYTMDSHNVQRYVKDDGFVQNEGDIGVAVAPYKISYGTLIPKREECENLLVPVCVSSSHIAFGSIRMEPVFMILGQSAATAGVLALESNSSVQDVDYQQLRKRLEADGQVLDYSGPLHQSTQAGIDPKTLSGLVVDCEEQGRLQGWVPSSSASGFVGSCYFHDDNVGKGDKQIEFQVSLPAAGIYEVRMSYTASSNRATNVPVIVVARGGPRTIRVNQKLPPSDGAFESLGKFDFEQAQASIIVSNEDTDGHVIVDAFQLLRTDDSR